MSPLLTAFAALLIVAQLALPRKIAFLPLLIAACHVGDVELWGEFTVARTLILLGLARAIAARHFSWTWSNPMDRLAALFSVIALITSLGHSFAAFNPVIARVGLILNVLGTYLYARAYLPSIESIKRYALCLCLVLVPFGAMMAAEQASGRNPYVSLGAHNAFSIVRDGRNRAQGPFQHPILAGTAGATALPIIVLALRRRKLVGASGIGACTIGTLASASSGPAAALILGAGALYGWRWRRFLPHLRWSALAAIVLLELLMTRPFYYVISMIDIAGGSTGWHRSRLIESTLDHLGEWWLYGTDYTRHWMASGVSWSPDHTDITNYYLHLGVWGGLPLMLCFIAIIVTAFRQLGRGMKAAAAAKPENEFVLWAVGCAILTHCVSFISISYFDQMYVLFYMLIGAVPGLVAEATSVAAKQPAPAAAKKAHPTAISGDR